MQSDLNSRCLRLISELALGAAEDVDAVEPLTGGVASDIARVRLRGQDICVKFALPKLKVAADWRAPVHRNAAEYAWLQQALALCPDSGVQLFGRSERLHGFAMEYLAGDDVYLWKSALLSEAEDRGEARAVADILGRIHAASTRDGFDRSQFQNRDDFRALRIEPYLSYTLERHPDLPLLGTLAAQLYQDDTVLVHGDVSPKNILMRGSSPILLDAECATMGDTSFDPAFCLNHLLLKAIHLQGSRDALLKAVGEFWEAYAAHVDWEDRDALEKRVSHLLPALMLARVDGKSPVEYLGESERAFTRNLARALLLDPPGSVAEITSYLAADLREKSL